MKTQLDQKGFALAIVLLFVLAIGCATAVLVPRALRWQHAAVVQYETDCLASDLRLMQQMMRTATVYPIEETAEHRLSDTAPEFELRDGEHAYIIWRHTYEGSLPMSSPAVPFWKSGIKSTKPPPGTLFLSINTNRMPSVRVPTIKCAALSWESNSPTHCRTI